MREIHDPHETEDKDKRRKIDVRNTTDATVFQTEKNLKEFGDKLDADSKAKIEAGLERVKAAMKTDNIEEMQASVDALNQIWQTAASTMYQSSSAGPNASSGHPGESASDKKPKSDDDKTVDAEFEVVND